MALKIPFLKKKKKIPKKIFEAPVIRAVDIIAPASIKIASNYLQLGERLSRSFFIFSYPRYLSLGWLSPVINLNIPMDISFFFHPIETKLILKQLRKRVTEVQAEIMEREEKGLIRDPALETAYRDIEELRDKLTTAQERMFQFGLYITIYGDSQKELREIETNLRSILEAKMIYIKPAFCQQKEGFVSSSPYGLDRLGVYTPMNTEPLSNVFPFVSFDLSSNEGILYGINRHNNSLVLFDRFNLENANSVVFAKAGAGKTVRWNEPVLIRNKHKIQLVKIGPFIEKLIKKYGAVPIDKEIEGVVNPPKVQVYSFDKDLKGEWSKVTVAMRKKAPKEFYKFTTRGGREIITTGDHNMLILKDGKIITAKSSDIKKRDFVPLPRVVPETSSPIKSINLLKLLKHSKGVYVNGAGNFIKENYKILKKKKLDQRLDRYLYKYRDGRLIPLPYFWKIINQLGVKSNHWEIKKLKLSSNQNKGCTGFRVDFNITSSFLKLLGYITAEGTITKRCVIISNNEPDVLKDLGNCFRANKIPFYYGKERIISASRIFVEILKALKCKKYSTQKKVPFLVFNLSKEKIAQYLSAYIEGDGGVENHEIVVVSKSKRLISEIVYLLYYFGIIGRIKKINKKPTNRDWKKKKTYYKLSVSGQDNLKKFAKHIHFISERKRKLLSKLIQKEGNTNVDLVPSLEKIFQEIDRLFGSQLHRIPEVSEWKKGVRYPSPQHLLKVINQIQERIQKFKNLSATYKILSELPELSSIIDLGKNKKDLNRALWKVLGQSWRVIKNAKINPFCHNAFKIIKIVNGKSYSLKEIKQKTHAGFLEMNLPIKRYNCSLQSALVDRLENNAAYETIQKAAQWIWRNYQDVLTNKIPLVEEKLAQLKILANSSLFWDPIIKIKKFENKKDKYVYDLTVDNEVFLAGQGGLFVHNSYAIKLEILRSLMLGVEVIILDPENEYKALSKAVGGSFFNISLASPNHLNPFDLPVPRKEEKPEDVLRSNTINLVGLLRIMLGGLTPEEDAIVDRALTETYAAKDITPETDPATWPERIPLMQDFQAVLEGMKGTESLVRRVRKFTKGTFAKFFNQPTNISTKKPLVVFGIRDMEDELRPMAMFIIMRYIWNKVRSELKKRILVIDEAWWIMQSEDGASFLYGMAKRARKYWLGVTTITQDVNDFMKSDYGQPIITNSSLQLLMKQSPATIDVVKKTFNLTEEEKYMLLEAAVGEGLFFAGLKHVAIHVVASYAEDQIVTTAPEELIKIKEAKKKLTR